MWLGSDDGSRLLIDGTEVLIADGVHPHSFVETRISLTAGSHPVVVEYFEQGGEESLAVDIAGPDLARQPMAGMVSNSSEPPEKQRSFQTQPELVEEGRRLFASTGCISCHQHKAVKETQPVGALIPQFTKMDLMEGCLSDESKNGVPRFALTQQQRSDIVAAVQSLTGNDSGDTPASRKIAATLLTLNCYACHQRDKIGGVERELDYIFTGSIPEMGDEGRLPPHLDGIGDKLQINWLKEVLNKGAKDRPYMATRMPKFGEQNVGQLIELLAKTDQKTEVPEVKFEEPTHRVIAEARLMVGDRALSCIKCHYFGKHAATGIQSLDMTTMTKRLRRDWFHRYLINPQAYRPGTRMPSAWPNNRSVVPKILHGDPAQQIEAMWEYLEDGPKAKLPSGLGAKAIELKPTERPIIYRNFIEGLSSRGIAVGYPEKAHFAWDAEQMNLRLIWHGAFIDAAKHWVGRGQGSQTPLGDHVMELTSGQPLAILDSPETPWPAEPSRDAGFSFQGYQLNKAGQPTFRYSWNGVSVTDLVEPVVSEKEASLRRTLEFTSEHAVAGLYFRVASASSVEELDGGWMLDNAILVKFTLAQPTVRSVNGKMELLVPVDVDANSRGRISYEMIW